MKKKLKAIELFAGIGGFRVALESLGIDSIWANDIDKTACTVYRNKFGNNELIQGDINDLVDLIPVHNILTAGFPCQPFSSAGKKQGIQDSRGTLFESIVKVLKKRRPEYFILENVRRLIEMDSGSHFATILSALTKLDYLIEWRLLNAMHFGLPQNRSRIIITGRLKKEGDVPGESCILIEPAELKEVKSADLFGPMWRNIVDHGKSFPNWGIAYNGKFYGKSIHGFNAAKPPVKIEDIMEIEVPKDFYLNDVDKRLANSALINKFVNGTHVLYNQKGGARMGYTIFGVDGLAPTLTSSTSRHYERYKIGEQFRRLTNIEYARIQGFEDNHCAGVPPYDQYKLYGNAVPPPMVKWVAQKLLSEPKVIIGIKEKRYATAY